MDARGEQTLAGRLPGERKKKRLHRKSREGCMTCRARRVKCDEQKPYCRRCINSRINCQGYQVSKSKKRSSVSVESTASPDQCTDDRENGDHDLPPEEKRLFLLYRHLIAPRVGGHFFDVFWNETLIIRSNSNPVLRAGIIALAKIYELKIIRQVSDDHIANDQAFFDYYNRAIRQIRFKLDDHSVLSTPLMMSILFFCIEVLRNNVELAAQHLDGSLKLYRMWQSRTSTELSGHDEEDLLFFDESVAHLLTFLKLLSIFFGNQPGTRQLYNADASICDSWTEEQTRIAEFQNLRQAHAQLLTTMLSTNSDPQVLSRSWEVHFALLLQRQWHRWSERERQASLVLRSLHCSFKVWAKGLSFIYETDWDGCKVDFEDMLGKIRQYTAEASDSTQPRTQFVFDFSLTLPLHLVLAKCRFPNLRHEALHLLQSCPYKEVYFDSEDICRLYLIVMDFEERTEEHQIVLDFSLPNDLPPERCRVSQIELSNCSARIQGGTVVDVMLRSSALNGSLQSTAVLVDFKQTPILPWPHSITSMVNTSMS